MQIDHFAFEVSNLDTALDFYVSGLGFNVQYKYTDPEVHEALAVLELAGGKLELIQVLNAENQPQPFEPIALRAHLCPHLALQTDDIDEVLTTIKARGVTLLREPVEMPGVGKWFFICDSDQNVIEFFQDLQSQQGAASND
jgi:catechol 2,3-dioxygenase-like lactoylglutathione lyase family enzyme